MNQSRKTMMRECTRGPCGPALTAALWRMRCCVPPRAASSNKAGKLMLSGGGAENSGARATGVEAASAGMLRA